MAATAVAARTKRTIVVPGRGGTNHGRNLYSVCAPCNIRKSDSSSRSFSALMATERAARDNRRLNYNVNKVAAPTILLGGVAFAILKDAYERWTTENPYATAEEREQAFTRFFWIPLSVGVAVVIGIIVWRMARR